MTFVFKYRSLLDIDRYSFTFQMTMLYHVLISLF